MYFYSMRQAVMMVRSNNSLHRIKVHLYYTPNHHDNSFHRIKVHLYYTPNHHDNSLHRTNCHDG
jgi:hypothetical protein